ncbi:MAG: hypothetical protein HUK40_01000 [Desulfobacter sp.]|nr:hypothetical protein [Desulfobacter sp.]
MPEIPNISSPIPQAMQLSSSESRIFDVAGKIADVHIDNDFLLGKMEQAPKSLWTRIKGIFTKQVGQISQQNLDYSKMSMASLKKDAQHILEHTGARPPSEYGIGSLFTEALTLPDLTGEDVSKIALDMAQSTLRTFKDSRLSGDSEITTSAYGILTSMDPDDITLLMAGQAMAAHPDLSSDDAMKLGKALYCGLISGLSADITPEVATMFSDNAFDYGMELSNIRSALTGHQGAITAISKSVENLDNPDWMRLLGEVGDGLRPEARMEMGDLMTKEVAASQQSLDSVKATIQSIRDTLEGSTSISDCTSALERLVPYQDSGSKTLEAAGLFDEHKAEAVDAAKTANVQIREQLTHLLDLRLDALADDLERISTDQLDLRLGELDSAKTGSLAHRITHDPFLSDSQKLNLQEKIKEISTQILTRMDGMDASYAAYEIGFNLLRREVDTLDLKNLVSRLAQLDQDNPGSLVQKLARTESLSETEKEDFITLIQRVRTELTDQFEQKTWSGLDTEAKQALMILASKGLLTDEFITQVNGMFGTIDKGMISPLNTLEGQARQVVINISKGEEADTHRLFGTSWGSSRAETILHAFGPEEMSHDQLVTAETSLFRGKEELLAHLPKPIASGLGFDTQTIDSTDTARRLSQTPVTEIINALIQGQDSANAQATQLLAEQNLALYALAQLELLIGTARGSDEDFDAKLDSLRLTLGLEEKEIRQDSIDTLAAKGFSGSLKLARAMKSSDALADNLARALPQTLEAFRSGMAHHPDMALELMSLKTAEFFIRLGMADGDIEDRRFDSLDSLNVGFGDGAVTTVIQNKLEADLLRIANNRVSSLDFSAGSARLSKLETALANGDQEEVTALLSKYKRLNCMQMEFKALAGAIQAEGIKTGNVLSKADIINRIKANFSSIFQGEPRISHAVLDCFLQDYEDLGSLGLDGAKAKISALIQENFGETVLDSFIKKGSTPIGVRSQLSGVLYHLVGGLKQGQTISASVGREHKIEIKTPESLSDAFLGGVSLEMDFAHMNEGTMAMSRISTQSEGVLDAYSCLVKPSAQTKLSLELGLAEGMLSLGVEGSVMEADGYIARFDSTRKEAGGSLYGFAMGFVEGRPSLDEIDEIDFILDTEATFGAKASIGIEDIEFSVLGQEGSLDVSAKAEFSRQAKGSTLITSSGNIERTGTREYKVSLGGTLGIDDTHIALKARAEFETSIDTRVITTRDGSVDESTQRIISAELGDDPQTVLKTLATLGGGTTPELEVFLSSLGSLGSKKPEIRDTQESVQETLKERITQNPKSIQEAITALMGKEEAQKFTPLFDRLIQKTPEPQPDETKTEQKDETIQSLVGELISSLAQADPGSVMETFGALTEEVKERFGFLFEALENRQSSDINRSKEAKARIHCSITKDAAQEITILRRRAKELSSTDADTSIALFDRAMEIEQSGSSYVPVEVIIEQHSTTRSSETAKPLLLVYTRTDSLSAGFVDQTQFDLFT